MKHILKSLFLLAALLTLASCQKKAGTGKEPLQVMTFNIRLDASTDSLNSWKFRKDNVARLVTYYRPDLLGMQEVLPGQLADLRQALPQYASVGVGRDDGKAAGEHCPIFFSRARFDLLEHGDFALSEHPEIFGVKGWDASYNRICTWAILLDKRNNERVAYFNTHLDNDGVRARREGIRLILERMSGLDSGATAILTGDFNCGPDEEPSRILASGGMQDAATAAAVCYGPSWSFHDFGRIPLAGRPLLDYVYVEPQAEVIRYRVIQDTPEEGYYSDHNPVLVEIR